MNRIKGFFVIAVLLVALVSTGFIAVAQAEGESGTSLYIQNGKSGSFIPIEGKENLYTLTLNHVSVWTIHITDTPEYATTKVHTRAFLDTVDFSDEPLSAVIELLEGDEEADLITVRITEPLYDLKEETLKYKAEIISHEDAPDYIRRHAKDELTIRVDKAIPESFEYPFVYIHSKEPVEEANPVSATAQHLNVSTAVVALSAPSTSSRTVAHQAAQPTPSKNYGARRHFQGSIEHVGTIEGTLVVIFLPDTYLYAQIELLGLQTSPTFRLSDWHRSYSTGGLLLKATATARFHADPPEEGLLSFEGCYKFHGRWFCETKTVISW